MRLRTWFEEVCRSMVTLRAAVLVVFALGTVVLGSSAATAQSSTDDGTSTLAPTSTEGISEALNVGLETFNGWLANLLFFSVTGGFFDQTKVDPQGSPVLGPNGQPQIEAVGFPFIVFILVAGGVFFTFFYRFIGIRGLRHALEVVRGKFDHADAQGDVSHFRALTSALSATVGLGNIAGVAIAIQIGGPGAVLWMMVAAFFGMSLKFNSCTLAQMFRHTNPDGTVSGGPMYYLDLGLRKVGGDRSLLARIGKVLGVSYAIMIVVGSMGGGNMFQANQSVGALNETLALGDTGRHVLGVMMAMLVGMVIIGGIQRIGAATSRIVPLMVGVYVMASLAIILANLAAIPASLALIFKMAFTGNAFYGGTVGVIVKGFQRAAFSNEAGIGSSAVAHAAAKTTEPVREGLVAMLEPVIDTMIVCLMTALVVVVTGVWNDPAFGAPGEISGVALTSAAFGSNISWFPWVLSVCVVLFAYSTMISWAYYGERGWIYLVDHFTPGLGPRSLTYYRVLFVAFVYVGAVTEITHVLTFSDLMILCMAGPNIVGGMLLAPTVKREVANYWRRRKSGPLQALGPTSR